MPRTNYMRLMLAAPVLVVLGCATSPDTAKTRELAENMVSTAYPGMPSALVARSHQDESQRICSKIGAETLSAEEATRVIQLARASIQYPPSGKLTGDWKTGQKLAYDGGGSRIVAGKVEPRKENGASCSNCHMLDPGEINAGNVGPALTGYGARGNSAAIAKLTYERIYNAWSTYPCSNMPRMGANGYLTPEQITHLVAFLIDPQSPVNKK
jgi:L-cysteine S-thiosulfotransferase